MSTIFDLIYREYCRARLTEMRKQLLIPIASDELLDELINELLEAHRDRSDPAGPKNRGMGRGTGSDSAIATKEAPTNR